MDIEQIIDGAMGKVKADIVIYGILINVYTGELIKDSGVAIKGNYIVRVGEVDDLIDSDTKIISTGDQFISPGLIDSHIHVESSMLCPTEFTKVIIPRGTTTVVIDPHEIANVLGTRGVELFLNETEKLPIRFLIEAPSCVPSLPGHETPGGVIGALEISQLLENPRIIGLAEVMNFPGVYFKDRQVISKIKAAHNRKKIVEGHAPLVSGKELQAYIAAGISSDHEATSFTEALEKLRLGIKLQIREGSAAKDLRPILEGIWKSKIDTRNCLIASDDRHPDDLLEKGHLDHSLRLMMEIGINPVKAIQMMTINTATHLKMSDTIGGIAPGKIADIVIFEDLNNFKVTHVIANGQHLYTKGKLNFDFESFDYPKWALNTTEKLQIPSREELLRPVSHLKGSTKINVIGLKEKSLLTDKLIKTIEFTPGEFPVDLEQDVLPVYVFDRHTGSKNFGMGFVHGLGMKNGAIATTVAHDCHQVICTGTNPRAIRMAIEEIKKIGGGYAVACQSKVVSLPLKLAGLMSTADLSVVTSTLKEVRKAVVETKCSFVEPMMVLSFVALPVIPHLKITDKGLFDVDTFQPTTIVYSEK